MPTVLRSGPYRFYFFSHEPGEPPHVHVARDNLRAKFWLEPVELAKNGGFADRELHVIRQIIEDNQEELVETWHGYFGTTADERVANIGITDELLSVQLRDGRIISVPLTWYPRLRHATKRQRDNWQVSGDGYAIHWPDIDEDLSTEGLLLGIPAAKSTIPIRRQPVDSEAIASIGYNKETRMLEIEFRDSGEVFRYLGVPEDEYRNFMTAESMGTYLNRDFKKAGYRYLRVH